MYKKYFLQFFMISLSFYFFLTDSSAQEYYPLQIGNRWDYKRTFSEPGYPPVIDTFSVEVADDSVFNNGDTYYILNHFDLAAGEILRVDSSYIIYLPKVIGEMRSHICEQIFCCHFVTEGIYWIRFFEIIFCQLLE